MKITVISTCSTSWSNLSNNLETIPWLSRIYAKKIFDTTIVLQYSVVTRGLLDPQYNRFSILTKTSTVTKTDLQSNITVASRTLSPLLFTTRWPCVNLKSPLRDFPRTWYPEIFRSQCRFGATLMKIRPQDSHSVEHSTTSTGFF